MDDMATTTDAVVKEIQTWIERYCALRPRRCDGPVRSKEVDHGEFETGQR